MIGGGYDRRGLRLEDHCWGWRVKLELGLRVGSDRVNQGQCYRYRSERSSGLSLGLFLGSHKF